MMYHKPQANVKRSEAFTIEQSVRQGFPLSALLYVRRLREEKTSLDIPFASTLLANVSAYADDINVFVYGRKSGYLGPLVSWTRMKTPTPSKLGDSYSSKI